MFAYLSTTTCTCGKVIGDRFVSYANLVDRGVDRLDAMNELGLNRICCRTSVISATPYLIRKGNTGTISIEQSKSDSSSSSSTPTVGRPTLTLTKRSNLSSTSRFSRPEPKQDFDYRFLNNGEVAVIGFERDEKGNVVMVDVCDDSDKYMVPRLQLCHGIAQNNLSSM